MNVFFIVLFDFLIVVYVIYYEENSHFPHSYEENSHFPHSYEENGHFPHSYEEKGHFPHSYEENDTCKIF